MSTLTFPSDRIYHKDHLWAKDLGDGIFLIGITDFAQDQLGEVIYIELPEPGAHFDQGTSCAFIESAKVASEAIMPLSGTVTEVNESLASAPETVNSSPYEKGWLIKIKSDSPAEPGTIDAEAYKAQVKA